MLRFNRKLIAETIAARIEEIQEKRKVPFTPDTGWAQVDGKGETENRDYGAWDALNSLMDDLGLWKEIEEAK
jgi:hypothetical protein